MAKEGWRRYGCLVAALASTGACAGFGARMELDPQLQANAPEQQVKGLAVAQYRKPVTYGPYQATVTKGGFQKSSTVSAGPWKRDGVEQSFEFTLASGSGPWSGACSFDASRHTVLWPVSEEIGFVCTLTPEGGSPWQLQLEREVDRMQRSLNGALTDGTTSIAITMSRQLAGARFATDSIVGYELRDPERGAIAAVQVIGPHFVWIDPGLPEEVQSAIAAGSFGLLMSASAANKTTSNRSR